MKIFKVPKKVLNEINIWEIRTRLESCLLHLRDSYNTYIIVREQYNKALKQSTTKRKAKRKKHND